LAYNLTWLDDNTTVLIHDGVNSNRMVLIQYSEEDKIAYRAKRQSQTGIENLRDAIIDNRQAIWRAAPLYSWFEQNCPGYQMVHIRSNDVTIRFAQKDHAMLFKLTWA